MTNSQLILFMRILFIEKSWFLLIFIVQLRRLKFACKVNKLSTLQRFFNTQVISSLRHNQWLFGFTIILWGTCTYASELIVFTVIIDLYRGCIFENPSSLALPLLEKHIILISCCLNITLIDEIAWIYRTTGIINRLINCLKIGHVRIDSN